MACVCVGRRPADRAGRTPARGVRVGNCQDVEWCQVMARTQKGEGRVIWRRRLWLGKESGLSLFQGRPAAVPGGSGTDANGSARICGLVSDVQSAVPMPKPKKKKSGRAKRTIDNGKKEIKRQGWSIAITWDTKRAPTGPTTARA